jgi:soluble lytic murein transglycosylase
MKNARGAAWSMRARIVSRWLCVAFVGLLPTASSGGESAQKSPFLSVSDIAQLTTASAAASARDWARARDSVARVNNAAARDVIAWRALASADSGATFKEIDRFIASHKTWPSQRELRQRAEGLLPAALKPDDVIAWFAGRSPLSGEGMLALATAYLGKGQIPNAQAWIRSAWVTGAFSAQRADQVSAAHAAYLTPADHQQRASQLIWNGNLAQAQAMRKYLDIGWKRLVDARIALRQRTRDASTAFDAVPAELRNDAGLLFDRAVWLRKRGQEAKARSVLIAAATALRGDVPNVESWWVERQYQAREALDAGDIQQAYQLAAGHRLKPSAGRAFAEAEFLVGWIALRFLGKPDVSLTHFIRLRDGVRAPTSLARAHYWIARSFEKSGRTDGASRHYKLAAGFPATFYGLLAAEAVAPKLPINLPRTPVPTASRKQAFMGQDTIQAIRALGDIGDHTTLRTFALGLADRYTVAEDFVLLSELLTRLDEPVLALRVAKRGMQKSLPLHRIAYPTTALPAHQGLNPAPEAALVLGLARQESEFDPRALSPAGARGLMQLMPATARLTAKANGLSLVSEQELLLPEVNARIGMAHLADLLRDFAGSYVLTIASYNAGAARANNWIALHGDPRVDFTDVVDWIERIPFNETRNYVQRVLENTQIYRSVLTGRAVDLLLADDLRRGSSEFVSPVEAGLGKRPIVPSAQPTAPKRALPGS